MLTKHPFYRVVVLLLAFAILAPSIGFAKGSGGSVHVKGYTRKDGTYVAPHYRSAPDGTKSNNWSTKGNVNPYTGKAGTKSADTPPADTPPATDTPTPPKVSSKPKSSPRTTPAIEKATIPKGDTLEGRVVGVTDGDTLTLLVDKTQYKIRLQGIDAPEKNQPFGNQSKKALSEKVFQKTVKVLSQGQDKYGRTLGIVYADGCVNTAMVKEGLAWHYKQYSGSKTLATAEEKAREVKTGLWADANPIAPWDWRHKPKPLAESAPSEQPAPAVAPEGKGQETEKQFWITSSSGKRHNSSCRYYENSKGHHCGPNDGVACKICGG